MLRGEIAHWLKIIGLPYHARVLARVFAMHARLHSSKSPVVVAAAAVASVAVVGVLCARAEQPVRTLNII